MAAGRDITITVGGKSTVQRDITDPSLRSLNQLSGGIKSIGSQLRGLRSLGGLMIGARLFSGLIGDLDEVSKRLGPGLGDDVTKLDESVGRLHKTFRGVTDEIVGRMAPALTELVGVWEGLANAAPVSGKSGALKAFEEMTKKSAIGIDKKSLEEQLKVAEEGKSAAGKLIGDALKERHALGGSKGNMDLLFGGLPRALGYGDKFDQLDKQEAAGKDKFSAYSRQVENLKREIAERDRMKHAGEANDIARAKNSADLARQSAAASFGSAAAVADKESKDREKRAASARAVTDREAEERQRRADALKERNMTQAERMRQEFADAQDLRKRGLIGDEDLLREGNRIKGELAGDGKDRMKEIMAAAPALAATEAGALTRGLGVKVDPEAQKRYNEQQAGKKKEEEDMKENNKLLQEIARSLEKFANMKGRSLFGGS